jgi:hypothetical protein
MERLTYITGEDIATNVIGKTITKLQQWENDDHVQIIAITIEGRDSPTMELRLPLDYVSTHPVYLHVHDDDPKRPQLLPGQLSIQDVIEDAEVVTPNISPEISSSSVTPKLSTEVSSSFDSVETPAPTDKCECGHPYMHHDRNDACCELVTHRNTVGVFLCDCLNFTRTTTVNL